MTWSEGRSSAATGSTGPRKEALDRVDGLLRALARDELLHDDLKQPDVRRAFEHWTGRSRLSQEEADELMEDNYRIGSVCEKMVELQTCCKAAGMGLPLARVLAGKGLYDSEGSDLETSGTSYNPMGESSSADVAHPRSLDTSNERRGGERPAEPKPEPVAASQPSACHGTEPPTWRQALVGEFWRALLACACAVIFSLALKFFRGENALGGAGPHEGGLPDHEEF